MEQAAETTTTQATTPEVVNRTTGKKLPAKKAAPKKRQASAPKAKGKTGVAAETKPKKGKKAAPTKPAPARGLGTGGLRRQDAWAAILANLAVGETYTKEYLGEQMVAQYGPGSSRMNHIWWANVYLNMCLALGVFAQVEGGYLYAGVTTFNPKASEVN